MNKMNKITKPKNSFFPFKEVGATLFLSKENIRYFSSLNHSLEFEGLLFLRKNQNPQYIVSPLEGLSSPHKVVTKKPKEYLKQFSGLTLGIDENSISVKNFKFFKKFFKLKDISNQISNMREIKSDAELKLIKKACLLSEKVLSEIKSILLTQSKKSKKNIIIHFKSENDIKVYIKKRAIDLDCELSFEPIVASGKNAAKPHYSKSTRLSKGFLVIDMGLKYRGYCADITRTFFIGTPSIEEKNIYNLVLKSQKEAISLIKPNIKISSLENISRKVLGNYSNLFIHSLGHGLGIDVHELPYVSKKSSKNLKKGMVITIEPGVYQSDSQNASNSFGIRIEDDVLVTSSGYKLLSNFPKKLFSFPKI